MNLKPLNDRLIVKVLEAEEKTSSGIILPDNAKEKPQQGKVVAVGLVDKLMKVKLFLCLSKKGTL